MLLLLLLLLLLLQLLLDAFDGGEVLIEIPTVALLPCNAKGGVIILVSLALAVRPCFELLDKLLVVKTMDSVGGRTRCASR